MLRAFAGLAWSRLRRRWRLDLARWFGLALAIALALTIALTQAWPTTPASPRSSQRSAPVAW